MGAGEFAADEGVDSDRFDLLFGSTFTVLIFIAAVSCCPGGDALP
jgi:hypothetical protein